jgi:hypothetical protein
MRILLGKTKSQITATSLMLTYLALVEEDKASARVQKRELQRLDSVHDEIIKIWPKDLNPSDYTNLNRVDKLCQDPAFTAQTFLQDLNMHPDAWVWYSGLKKPDIVGMLHQDASSARRQELIAIYGEAAVSAAWNSIAQRFGKGLSDAESNLRREGLKKASEQASEAKAAQEKRESDPREIERARSRVEALISGVRISNNHAVNAEAKAHLRSLEDQFTKRNGSGDVNWFRYEEAVKAYINSVTSTSIR